MRPIMFMLVAAFALTGPSAAPAAPPPDARPTIILVHGAFADSSSWNAVITDLARDGYPVIAAAVPLRSLAGDAAYVRSLAASIAGPVVLVGHSYGGSVISVAAAEQTNVKALVFVAGFAPEIGESPASLGARFPTGSLGENLAPPVLLADGSADLYILQARYWKQFAADVPEGQALEMAATQRPIAQSALSKPAAALAWRKIPSWFVWGELDRNIPAALHSFMARRADARDAIQVSGGSHVVMISHPDAVSAIIRRAAGAAR
jgi:pimeloyl-ACP methyl ester carboxylesterase